jgi:hypothetical protein
VLPWAALPLEVLRVLQSAGAVAAVVLAGRVVAGRVVAGRVVAE